ncbi:MAG: chalcone isomerase family protein [Gallionella sp.]
MKTILLLLCLFGLSSSVLAVELAGVKLPDDAHLHLGTSNLVLNGAGVHSRYLFDLYVAALYLKDKKTSAAAVMDYEGDMRIALHLLRTINQQDLFYGLNQGIKKNTTDTERLNMKDELDDFSKILHNFGLIIKGETIEFDYRRGLGTEISVNGNQRGRIPGRAFYNALLKIWLGDKPVQEDLKLKLLGG